MSNSELSCLFSFPCFLYIGGSLFWWKGLNREVLHFIFARLKRNTSPHIMQVAVDSSLFMFEPQGVEMEPSLVSNIGSCGKGCGEPTQDSVWASCEHMFWFTD